MTALVRSAGKGVKWACIAAGAIVIYAGAKAKFTGEPVTLKLGLTEVSSKPTPTKS